MKRDCSFPSSINHEKIYTSTRISNHISLTTKLSSLFTIVPERRETFRPWLYRTGSLADRVACLASGIVSRAIAYSHKQWCVCIQFSLQPWTVCLEGISSFPQDITLITWHICKDCFAYMFFTAKRSSLGNSSRVYALVEIEERGWYF